jgi:RNA polymerase sigma-70 factor (ECF subfamily)
MDGLMAWTRKIMVNECLQQLRRRKRIWFPDDEIPETEEVSNLPEIAMDAEIYFDLIRQLPESQKTVFNLYVVEGYTHLEIAEVLQIPENTSRSYLMRARNELQIKIKKMHENELQ